MDTSTKTETKEEKIKIKVIDKVNVSHSGKIYKPGEIIEMTKPEMERLKAICKITEVK
jgi:hypothetical protein